MSPRLIKALKPIAFKLLSIGIDVRKIASLRYLPQFFRDKRAWLKQGGMITNNYMILSDYGDSAGTAKGHYFHQDLIVSNLIYEHNPNRHIDVASRIDGFVAHVASFREIEVMDVRPLAQSEHKNIRFVQADLMAPQDVGMTDSLSCLHAIEHFGMGRYTDPLDVDGHNKGIKNLVDIVSPGGRLYISFPIGDRDAVYFNAHRIFAPTTILSHPSISQNMRLLRFDFVDDAGNLHPDCEVDSVETGTEYGCGIYTFEKSSNGVS